MGEEGMENIPLLPRGFLFLFLFCDNANLAIFFPKNNSIDQNFHFRNKIPKFSPMFPIFLINHKICPKKNLIMPLDNWLWLFLKLISTTFYIG